MDKAETAPLILSAFRRRWWMLPLIALVSGVIGYLAAENFGKTSATSQAAILQVGLPGGSDSAIYTPLGAKTCSELLTSVRVLQPVLEERDSQMPVSTFAELITVSLTRNSDLINVELDWGSPDEAMEVLNRILDGFVLYVADMRRGVLRDHIKHTEVALLDAKGEVDLARSKAQDYRRLQQQKIVEEGGFVEGTYSDLVSTVSSTQYQIQEELVQKQSIEQKLKSLAAAIEVLRNDRVELAQSTKIELLREATKKLTITRDHYAENAPASKAIGLQIEALKTFAEKGPDDLQAWHAELLSLVYDGERRLGPTAALELADTHALLLENHADRTEEYDERIRELRRLGNGLELQQFPVDNTIGLLESRLTSLQGEVDGSEGPNNNLEVGGMDKYESAIEDAQSHEKELASQLAGMKELEKCSVNEWSISVPAGPETTKEFSNYKKIFAFTFGLCGIALTGPLVLAEWLGCRESADVEFARTMQLPLVAQNIVDEFGPRSGSQSRLDEMPTDKVEAVRRLALRIQQSCQRSDRGATIVFSSLGAGTSVAPLIAAVAECLRDREERVLLVNAIPSDQVISWKATRSAPSDNDSVKNGQLAATGSQGGKKEGKELGLGEYLAAECEDFKELIMPSGNPGVDIIGSGSSPFPREAMASSSLTKLLESCSESYSMILINGPSAERSADLQMLASHADGLVLATTDAIAGNREAKEALSDLIELNAPIIGLVS